MSLKVIGAGLSPFVRKVRVTLSEKGLDYEHDPMVPFGVSDEYKRMHPLGKIPTLVDGERVVPDSSAICQYLEGVHPEPALYPADPYERARAIWLEEFADAGIINGTIVPFQQRILGPLFLKQEGDEAKVEEALSETLPPFFDYLERELGDADYLVAGRFGIADVALGSQLATFAISDAQVDAARWPRLAAYTDRILSRPSFKALVEEDRAGIEAMRG